MGEVKWARRSRRARVLVGLLVATLVVGAAMPLAPAVAQVPEVRINELGTSNDSLVAADGSTPDWIELRNTTSSTTVDLTNWALTDDPARPQKWVFPAGTSLAPGDYLLVFASGSGVAIGAELHTNFSLSSTEYLGLVDPSGSVVDLAGPIPALAVDDSWGVDVGGEWGYFTPSTPDAPNGAAAPGLLDDVVASPGRGFFDAAVDVALTAQAGATIRYTTDGSAPTTTRGTVYSQPIRVDATTVLRAFAYADGWKSQRPVTHTYVFASDVPNQSRMVAGIVNGNRANIEQGLESLPVISLVSNVSPGSPRWTFPAARSATTVEMIFPDGTEGFQVDAGTYEVGGHSVGYPKDSLRLVFGTEWGESKLDYPVFDGADNPASPATDEFKRLTLRMGAHDSGFYAAAHRAFVRARFHDETMLDLGHVNSHGRFVSVFLNGQYWGQYHLREHFDDHFMASYFGGDNSEYVGINRGAISTGEGSSWAALVAASRNWSAFRELVDPTAYIDWMLLTEYGGNTWDLRASQNWRGAGPADEPTRARYIFQSSDPDISLVSTTARTSYPGPSSSWHLLINERDPDFLALVNDRIHALLSDDGALGRTASQARLARLSAQIDRSIYAEWARWSRLSKTNLTDSLNWLANTLFVQRPGNLLGIFNQAGLVSAMDAPQFGAVGDVAAHSQVSIANPNGSGTVYVTTDGTDPRLAGGGVSASARAIGPQVQIDHDTTITARVRSGDVWSAVETANFVAVPDPNAPEVDAVPDLVDVAGFATGYAIDAADPKDAALTYSASELPAGLSIDPATGLIHGAPTTPLTSDVLISVSNGAHATNVAFEWRIEAAAVPANPMPLVLNEYNAVQATTLLGDGGADDHFGRVQGNGGDWLELVVTADGTDLRGWSVELSSRKEAEILTVSDTFTFSQSAVLADLRAGTLITIAEDGLEDLSYAPDSDDWHIAAIARTGYASQLIAQPTSDFDTNRHEFRVRVLDASGAARSPYMGETDHWDSIDGNVSGTEVMALCSVPDPAADVVGVYADQKARSTFGAENVCDDTPQSLLFLRGGIEGDVNCDTLVTDADVLLMLDALAGMRETDGRCPNPGDAIAVQFGDVNDDGTTNLLDALLIARS